MSIYTTLLANTAVTNIIGNKVDITQASNTKAPYIVLDFVSINPENYVSDLTTDESQRVAINCIGRTQLESINLYKAARNALQLIGNEQLVPLFGEQDKSTGLYLTIFDFKIWQTR